MRIITWPLSATSIGNEANRNLPPNIPSNPFPLDGATNELTGQFLSWTGGDSDGDLVKYDVWFGESVPNNLIAENISEKEFFIGDLSINTLFSWQIVAIDENNFTNESPIWTFTTSHTSDFDGDGLTDSEEIFLHGTDPRNADTDGGGANDYDEVTNGYNPLKSSDDDIDFFITLEPDYKTIKLLWSGVQDLWILTNSYFNKPYHYCPVKISTFII